MRAPTLLSLLVVCSLLAGAQTITLTSEKEIYFEDDVRAFADAILAPSGERVVLHAVIQGLNWAGPGCPSLTELLRLPDGSDRESELPGAKCFQDASGRIEVKFDAGHVTNWYGLGDYYIRLAMGGKHRDPDKTFPISNEIVLTVADAAAIKRNWGPKDHGVAVDLTLDKDTFALGEDVALHLAFENFNADVPIYGFSPEWDPLHAVKIEVREDNGQPVRETCMRAWTSGGPAAMWRFPIGMIVPTERSLAGDGFLPNHPGVFTVSVSWNVFRGEDDTCHACQVSNDFDLTKPYAIAHSHLKSFKISNGPKPSIPCL